MKFFSPFVEMLFGARYDRRTKEHLIKAGFKLKEESFVHLDIILMLVGQIPE